MEGRISRHFYNIQCVHLAMPSSYLNGKDWTKQFIDRIPRITHSQWIYRNVCMHDKKEGYLHQREMEEMKDKAEELAETNPADLPRESRYLLEMDGEETKHKTYNDLDYWIRAVEAAKTAGRRIGKKNSKRSKLDANKAPEKCRMERLGVRRVEREILRDKKEREEIETKSRNNKGETNKDNEENTAQANTRRNKGNIPGD